MIDSISSIFGILKKIAPIPLLALGIASGFILFAPSSIIAGLGITPIRNNYTGILGTVFVFSWAYLLAHMIGKEYILVSNWYDGRKTHKTRIGYLHELTPEEKEYLAPYILQGKNTIKYRIADGIVGGLAAKGILYQASIFGDLNGFEYNLQPWARKHLEYHRELLSARC